MTEESPKPLRRRKLNKKFTPERQKVFIDVLKETFCVTVAAAEAGVTTSTVYYRKKNDPKFAEEFKYAWEHAVDVAEGTAYELGVRGYEREPVMYQGKQCIDAEGRPLFKRAIEPRMLELILKGNRGKRYGDKQEITGKDGKPLMDGISIIEAARRIAFLLTQAQRQMATVSEPQKEPVAMLNQEAESEETVH